MGEEIEGDIIRRVVAALENLKFKWRTVGGISKEAGVAPDKVLDVIKASDIVVRSGVPSESGDSLFTTRARFRQSASVAEKLRGAFTNRLD
jgi:hypothetical protein